MRRRWLSLCTVWLSHSQISSLSTAILALGKARSRREPNVGCRRADRAGWCDALPKKPARELYNRQAHCRDEADLLVRSLWMRRSHSTVIQSTASHCRLTNPTGQWLFRMRSKVSSDWLPCYIEATQPVLQIFKMAGYFPDSSPLTNTTLLISIGKHASLTLVLNNWMACNHMHAIQTVAHQRILFMNMSSSYLHFPRFRFLWPCIIERKVKRD